MQRGILLTGLVRNPDKLGLFLAGLESHPRRAELPLVFSTWRGEVARYPDIADALRRLGATVVEQNQPNLVLPGHALHQLVTLDGGLSMFADDTLVLKARPDFCHASDIDRLLNVEATPCPPNRVLPSPTEYTIRISSAFAAHPFYINDITFVAVASDLRHLASLPLTYLTRYNRMAPEQLYWAGGLRMDRVPVFDSFMRINIGLIFNNEPQFRRLRDVLIASPLFPRVVAAFTLFVSENLDYLWPDNRREQAASQAADFTLEDLLWGSNASGIAGLNHHPTAYTNSFQTAGLWDALRTRRFAASAFGDRFGAALDAYAAPDGMAVMRAQRPMLTEEATRLGDEIQDVVGIGGLKHFHDADQSRTIDGAPPNWTLGQTGTALTVKLEQENNELRRLADQLTRQVAAQA
jgi:hypothetical protein